MQQRPSDPVRQTTGSGAAKASDEAAMRLQDSPIFLADA